MTTPGSRATSLVCAASDTACLNRKTAEARSGHSDYIVKLFLRTARRFVLGALAIDYVRRQVTVDGHRAALTAREYELLRVPPVHAGRMVTSASLLRQAWDNRKPTDTDRVRAFVK